MPVPCWNLRPDKDIARTAHSLLAKLPIQLQHVKSHQDNKHGPTQINFEAQMNILADEEATRQRNTMCGPAEDVHNIAIAQLRIADMAITRDSQQWLLQAAGKIPIQQYYLERHGWTREVFDSISWETQRAVIRTYNHEDQMRILKFVHGWLPTQHRRAKEGASSSQRCRLCNAEREDNMHLFACKHTVMEQLQAKIAIHINKWLHENGDSEMTNIFEIGLQESTDSKGWQPDSRYVSPRWKPAVNAQSKIGWQHIFHGRLARELILSMDQHYHLEGAHNRTKNGEQWARKLIQTIWDTMLSLWRERNNILNKQDEEQVKVHQKEATKQRVQECYAYKDNLRHAERIQWFSDTLHELLKKDT
jgi:hypothetical protein